VVRRAEGGAQLRAHRVLQREVEQFFREGRLVTYVREDEAWAQRAVAAGASYARPDLTLEDATVGLQWVVDVTVADAQGDTGGVDTPGCAAAAAERRKEEHYASALAVTTGAILAPVAVETFGGLGAGALRFLRRLAELCSGDDRLGLAPALAHHYAQRLSVALLREQAQQLRRWAAFQAHVRGSEHWRDSTDALHADCVRSAALQHGGRLQMSVSDLSGISLACAAFA